MSKTNNHTITSNKTTTKEIYIGKKRGDLNLDITLYEVTFY